MVSTFNPFRTPVASPNPTGASTSSAPQATSSPSGVNASSSSANTNEASASTSRPQANGSRTSIYMDRSVNDLLTEELPPAYTPSPNVYEGEATIELGPRRPFQDPVPVPRQNQPQWMPPQSTSTASNSWSSFPGDMGRAGSSSIYTYPTPPPVHPSLQNLRTTSSRPVSDYSPSRPISDFARDFYNAGADVNAGVLGGPSAQYQGEGSSSSTRFAPPPGEPPNRSAGYESSQEEDSDDGHPTETPVPGHPLLRHGKILVYPRDYECDKCHNTGYKNYDPSHPCARCWDKYAKPYTSIMAAAPWPSDSQSGTSSSRTTYQRPLPRFRAPRTSLHSSNSSYSGSPSSLSGYNHSRSASTSRASSGYPGSSARVIPIPGGGVPVPHLDPYNAYKAPPVFPPSSWFGSSAPVIPQPAGGNVVVYPPGDPRIGGRLCWRCGGTGRVSFFIFQEDACSICNGVGRTFV
ncbi:hypothetical protein GY45DRAFT_1320560 [Cubamyces sp. BRFM 1775]|nr:hypothetical protein GY45DRAFT_1320560 [Cubamyces sp. BRFM 1775]